MLCDELGSRGGMRCATAAWVKAKAGGFEFLADCLQAVVLGAQLGGRAAWQRGGPISRAWQPLGTMDASIELPGHRSASRANVSAVGLDAGEFTDTGGEEGNAVQHGYRGQAQRGSVAVRVRQRAVHPNPTQR